MMICRSGRKRILLCAARFRRWRELRAYQAGFQLWVACVAEGCSFVVARAAPDAAGRWCVAAPWLRKSTAG